MLNKGQKQGNDLKIKYHEKNNAFKLFSNIFQKNENLPKVVVFLDRNHTLYHILHKYQTYVLPLARRTKLPGPLLRKKVLNHFNMFDEVDVIKLLRKRK